jgi:hypothetical protein
VLDLYRAAGGHYTEHVLSSCGHSPQHPAEFAKLVTDFLASASE